MPPESYSARGRIAQKRNQWALHLPLTLICASWQMGRRDPDRSSNSGWGIASRMPRANTVLLCRKMKGANLLRPCYLKTDMHSRKCNGSRLVIAAATIAAHWAWAAKFDPPAVNQNLDSFVSCPGPRNGVLRTPSDGSCHMLSICRRGSEWRRL